MAVRRRIDPDRQDYVLVGGNYEKDEGVSSEVLSRMSTRKGSVIVLPNFGSQLHTIRSPLPGWDKLAIRYTENCLADLVAARKVNQLTIAPSIERNGMSAALVVEVAYRDRKGRPQKVRYTTRLGS